MDDKKIRYHRLVLQSDSKFDCPQQLKNAPSLDSVGYGFCFYLPQ